MYMWHLKNNTNEQAKQKTNRLKEQTGGCQRGVGLSGWVK